MIVLYNNQSNKVVLTLTETARLADPFYLFEFKSDFNPEYPNIYFTTSNDSHNTCRYDLFDITLNSTGSTTGGISVPLKMPLGQYTYNVFEASAQTLSTSATTGSIIETGRLIVIDSTVNTTLNNNSDTNSIYI